MPFAMGVRDRVTRACLFDFKEHGIMLEGYLASGTAEAAVLN